MGPYGSQGGVKRELVFPVDSVEATTPVLYKRRRLGKGDVAPIEAWRIMMALKSGLLAETVWALDVLNILLFDDSTIAYFGLLHLPGLMEILLEHMKRSLGDMLEPQPGHPSQWFEEAGNSELKVDLGEVEETPDPSDRIPLLKSSQDYTSKSRKGHPVSVVPASEDIFVRDGRRKWDSEELVDEASDQEVAKYIVTCFRAEFGKIPFVRTLSGPTGERVTVKKEEPEEEEEAERAATPPPEPEKPAERKKKAKTLSDVLSRIKKESPASEEEAPAEASPLPEARVKEEPAEEVKREEEEREKEREEEDKWWGIRDPAGTLKRRRISDYEDECYTKDEASLYLVTESQDNLARRCVCLSTILRNLTFVPGNETEFAKSGTFLGLVGKLLLLHHEHPPRQTKQRNYDREEDADFTDSCSSLHGDHEWWWEFLHHLRENALVSIANIAGHVDLGLYPEDVSRPILDGLLHWAVCPSAQGQDPFPTVSAASSLSPQRLALEALCKLCVTDSNVDLVIATPPYCRLERLAQVLTRLLCRSEEQVPYFFYFLPSFYITPLKYLFPLTQSHLNCTLYGVRSRWA
jgi:AT-rich interactive domain-containing protein 1